MLNTVRDNTIQFDYPHSIRTLQLFIIFIFGNENLYNICYHKLGIEEQMYTDLYQWIGQIVHSITASLEFNSAVNIYLIECWISLVPHPKNSFIGGNNAYAV